MAIRTNSTGRKSKSVIINRAALTALQLGIADGFLAVGQQAVDNARPNVPDAPPYGKGLIRTGGYVVYAGKRKVGGNATISRVDKSGIVLYAGFGFPGRFQEMGTVHQPARPFFTPAFLAASRNLAELVRPSVAEHLRGVK